MILTKGLGRVPVYQYQIDTQFFMVPLVGLGYTIKERSLQHLDKFVRDCKEAGFFYKLQLILPFCGDQLGAAMIAIRPGGLHNLATAVNFAGGDYSEDTGLQGNGTTKYINLNWDASQVAATSSIAAYVRDDSSGGIQYWIGCNDGGGTQFMMIGTTTPASDAVGRVGGTTVASMAGACTKGFYYSERSSSTDLRLYRNNVQVGSNVTSTTVAMPSANFFAFARNAGGTPTQYVSSRLSFLSIGGNLTAQERSDYYNIVQTLQSNLGRAV